MRPIVRPSSIISYRVISFANPITFSIFFMMTRYSSFNDIGNQIDNVLLFRTYTELGRAILVQLNL